MEKQGKAQKVYKVIMLIVITAFITFFITSLSLYTYFTKNEDGIVVVESSNNNTDLNNKLGRFKAMIDKYFLGEVDEAKLEDI